MTVALIGSAALFVVVGLVLAPAVAWLDRRQRAWVTGRPEPVRLAELGASLDGLLAPFTDTADWIARGDRLPPGAAPVGSRLAVGASWLAAWLLFAVIPFGGRYVIVHDPISPVVADLDWGLALVLVAPALAVLGTMVAGISGSGSASLLGGLRAGRQGAASLVALAASMLPVLVLYGTLRPADVGLWQDAVIPFAPLLRALGLTVPEWLPAGAGLPAWGALLNPPAFVLFGVASMVVVARAPFDAPFGRDLAGGVASELSGARRVIFAAAGHVWTLAFASLIVLLFLGGWSIPWITQATLVGWIAPHFGSGFAELVCAGAHVGSFGLKLAVVVRGLVWLRWTLPALRDDQVRALCLRRVVPFALLDAFATAAVLVALGGAIS